MFTLMMVMLVLAAIYGFLLGLYLFLSRKAMSTPLRWIGGIAGGVVLSGAMAFLAFLILWPPISLILIAGVVGLVVLLSSVILFNKNEPALNKLADLEWEVNGNDVDEFGTDININHGN